MANTSARMLRLLSLLETHRYWPGAELADRLQVSQRTLRRDVDRLRELGYPVQAQRGVTGGYQLAAGTALPPLLVDDGEAVALAVGLQAAAESAVEGIAESSVRALAKVVQVMPARLRRRVEALGAMTVPASWGGAAQASVDPGILTGVAVACRDTVEVLINAPAAAVRERIGRWATVENAGPGRCRIRMTADSLDWPTMALGAVGADFEVVSPPELADHVRDWGRRFSRAGGPG